MGSTEIQELERRLEDLEEEVRLLKDDRENMRRDLIRINNLLNSVAGFELLTTSDSDSECEM